MSIKNPHTIHKVRNGKYVCIGAVDPTPEKSSFRWKKVTCKNCLKQIPDRCRDLPHAHCRPTLIPVYLDPLIVEIAKRETPLTNFMPKHFNARSTIVLPKRVPFYKKLWIRIKDIFKRILFVFTTEEYYECFNPFNKNDRYDEDDEYEY